ncbi:MAG: M23 family metallopeptidase, partial [Anaerolineales bacterium]|nr:M23 family metallopeptidase [Anaerolineales bacterium]
HLHPASVSQVLKLHMCLISNSKVESPWKIFLSFKVEIGSHLVAGDKIGHPSCEGGISTGTHLHIARRYNGEWIPADQDIPFIMDGWVSQGLGYAYQGIMTRGEQAIQAEDSNTDYNHIQR